MFATSTWSGKALLVLAVLLGTSVGYDEHHREPNIRNAGKQTRTPGAESVEQTAQYWIDEAQAAIAARRVRHSNDERRARNVVMFLGDGMSVPTLTAARTLMGQRAGRTGEESRLAFEQFPTLGLAKTYCVDAQVADSACSATAYLCGVKANRGTIGVTGAVPRWHCNAALQPDHRLQSIAAWALEDGRDAGIVTTTRVTHASPAGAYARTAARDWESDAATAADCGVQPGGVQPGGVQPGGVQPGGVQPGGVQPGGVQPGGVQPDIAHQLVHEYPGNRFKVILGGGRREFLPSSAVDEEGAPGRRQDGNDLIEQWQVDKISRNVSYSYVWNRDQLLTVTESPPEYLLGLFEGSHLQYHMEANATTEPTLAELTEAAIKSLSKNEKGFFLFVEGGRIDHAHHDNLVHLALDETIELSAAVARAAELLPEEDSLIVVTADHAHVMTFNGYTRRGGDVLGPSDDLGDDGVPYMTLSYANGPGFRPAPDGSTREDLSQYDYHAAGFAAPAMVPLASETHGGEDVAVFARGPQHGMFAGLYEQSQLPHLMAYAACIGPGMHVCSAHAQHSEGNK